MTTMRDLMMIVEGSNVLQVDFLYHLTDGDHLEMIFDEGLDPGSYFGLLPVIQYYLRMKLHRTDVPVVLRIPMSRFHAGALRPDLKGIQDPPSADIVGMTPDELDDEWDASSQDWIASLRLIGSVRYNDRLGVNLRDVLPGGARVHK